MTKEDTKKALEICADISIPCNNCPYDAVGKCNDTLCADARELITEQEKEIERLKAEVKQAQIDVLNRVMTYINDKIENDYGDMSDSVKYLTINIDDFDDFIDELIKEVENGEDKG